MTDELEHLQGQLAIVDAVSDGHRSSGPDETLSLLVVRLKALKVKMYKEASHRLPHVHIDYGGRNHAASYSIHDGCRLAGTLSTKYDLSVTTWISEHRETLLKAWEAMQSGDDPICLIGELPGNG